MAINRRKDGTVRLQEPHPVTGRKMSIPLWPGVLLSDARIVQGYLKRLCRAIKSDAPVDYETAQWLRTTPKDFQATLIRYELLRGAAAVTVGSLCEEFLANWSGAESTRALIARVCDCLQRAFGGQRAIHSITQGDAKEFVSWLRSRGGAKGGPLAEATAARRARRAREIFGYAVDKEWLRKNPFAGIRPGKEANRDRDFFVSREVMDQVLQSELDVEFRRLLVLYRYGGLRVHEALGLTWEQVCDGFLRVHSAKTGWREVPLWPEIAAELQPLGTGILAPKYYRTTRTNLANKLSRTCRKAGIVLWPKPFQNMRASRETELYYSGRSPQDVASWLGHSLDVAVKHYLQIVKERTAAEESRQ